MKTTAIAALYLSLSFARLAGETPAPTTTPPSASGGGAGSLIEAFLGMSETDAGDAAARLFLDLTKAISPLELEIFKVNDEFAWMVRPEIEILLGEEDSFNGIRGALTGAVSIPTEEELLGNDPLVKNHGFAVAAGVETDGDFETVNGIVEIGYVPQLNSGPNGVLSFLPDGKGNTQGKLVVGVYGQGGYKFNSDQATVAATQTPDHDASQEQEGDGLFRVKAKGTIESPVYEVGAVMGRSLDVQFLGRGEVWYDIVNSEVYHRAIGTLRLHQGEGKFIDFNYETGSGAPNFNEGEQFSAGLTLRF